VPSYSNLRLISKASVSSGAVIKNQYMKHHHKEVIQKEEAHKMTYKRSS
jgi:hypothetical protein